MPAKAEAKVLPMDPAQARALLRLLGVITFTLLTSMGAYVAVPLPPFGVPQTLQTLAVVLAALCLGPKLGMASMGLYALMGAVGAAVFAEGEAGLQVVLGQTFGYIVGFIACQPVMTAIIRRPDGSIRGWGAMALASLAGHGVIFALGVPWLYFVRNSDAATAVTWGEALHGGFVVFIPGTIVKTIAAVAIGRIAAPWASKRIW